MISLIALFAFLILSGIAGAILAIFMFKTPEYTPYVEETTPANPGFGANLAAPNFDKIALREKSYSFGC